MKRFLSDAAFTLSSQIISALAALGVQIYAAQATPLIDYGKYAAIHAYVLLIEAIFVARSGEVALEYIGKYWKVDFGRASWYREHLVSLDIRVNLLIYGLTILLGFVLSSTLNFEWTWLVLLALTIPGQIGHGVWKAVFIVDGRLKQQASFEIVYSIIFFAVALGLIAWHGIVGLVLALVFAAVLKTLLARQITQSYWPLNIKAPAAVGDEHDGRRFRAANIHSVLRNALMNGAVHADLLLLNAIRGAEAAALYKVAKTVAALPTRAVAPGWVAIRPRLIASMRNQDFERLRRMLIWPALVFTAVGVVMVWPLTTYGEALIVMAFGESYGRSASPALWLLLGTWILGAISGWLSFACAITSRKWPGSLIYSVWFLGILIGGALWGHHSGTSMAVVATSSMVIAALIAWLYFLRQAAWLDK